MKRQRSRNRGGSGGNKPQHNANRAFESNGPDNVKIRGAAQHVFEKYQQLARDALTAGDRILGESYQQHAEHYFRVLRAVQPQRPASDIMGRDSFTSGIDIDFEDETGEVEGQPEAAQETGEGGERNGEWRQDGNGNGNGRYEGRRDDRQQRNYGDQRPRDDRQRDDRPRDDRPREDRFRDDRPRDDRQRDDRQRDERPREDRAREDRPREDRPRERFRDDRRYERGERQADPLAVVEPHAQPLTPEPEPTSPMLRSQDGGESHAPAFLQARPAAAPEAPAEDEPRPRVRRRRAPRSLEGASEAPASEADAPEEA
jgi:hypothetical protein